MSRRIMSIAAAAVLAACVLSAAVNQSFAAQAAQAPAFTLEDQDGKKVSLADFAGKIVVLECMNWECPFSKRHMQAGTIKRLAEKYKGKDVVFLGMNSTSHHNVAANKKAIEDFGLPYSILDDRSGQVGKAYGAKTTPDIRIIAVSGSIAYKGAMDNDTMGRKAEGRINYVEQALDELLAGKEVSTPETKPYGCTVKYAK